MGLVITTVYHLAQVGAVTAAEKFAFQQPLKYSQRRRCILRRWRQTVPHVTQNARSPMVVRRALGMSNLAEAEDRSLLRDSKAATGGLTSDKYLCLRPHYHVHVATLSKCPVTRDSSIDCDNRCVSMLSRQFSWLGWVDRGRVDRGRVESRCILKKLCTM